jgi:chitinase
MRIRPFLPLVSLALSLTAHAQGTVPTFTQGAYTLVGQSPAQNTVTTIPTVLVPVNLVFEAKKVEGSSFVMDAKQDVPRVLHSPIFTPIAFAAAGKTQYADALLRTTFPSATNWHTQLSKPEIKPVTLTIPVGFGYILTSQKTHTSFAVADLEFVQRALFQQLP